MPYKGFVGAGTVGHFSTTTDLQARFPADLYAGRRATVEIVTGTATQYFSDGGSWKAVPTLVTYPLSTSVAVNSSKTKSPKDLSSKGLFLFMDST